MVLALARDPQSLTIGFHQNTGREVLDGLSARAEVRWRDGDNIRQVCRHPLSNQRHYSMFFQNHSIFLKHACRKVTVL